MPLSPTDGPQGLHGSVLGSGQAREWLQFLMGRQPKDALLYLRKWVKEAARKEGLQIKSGRSKLTGRSCHDTWQPTANCLLNFMQKEVLKYDCFSLRMAGVGLPVVSMRLACRPGLPVMPPTLLLTFAMQRWLHTVQWPCNLHRGRSATGVNAVRCF